MSLKLHPEILEMLHSKSPEEIQALVNDLLFLYLKGDLIKPSEIIKRIKIPVIFLKEFDAQAHEFPGVVVADSLWVPGIELKDMLQEYAEIAVLNTPRKEGIRRLKTKRSSLKRTAN